MPSRKPEFHLDKLAGETVRLAYPSEDDDDEGVAAFDRMSRAIGDEWIARRATLGGDLSLRRWCTLVAYEALTPIMDAELTALFHQRIEIHRRHSRGVGTDLHPVQYGLMALFAHDGGEFRRADRQRIANDVWYAYRHFVPQAFLLGFLMQVQLSKKPQNFDISDVEPGLEKWIAERMASPKSPGHVVRGVYPETVMAEKARLLKARTKRIERREGRRLKD